MEECGSCLLNEETIDHLFFSCSVTTNFWQDLVMNVRIDGITPLSLTQVLYNNDFLSKELAMLQNVAIIKGKYHIHKCKWQNKSPSLIVLKVELKSFFLFSSLELLKEDVKMLR